jgi:GNAT superfamily N-acetyltransferase
LVSTREATKDDLDALTALWSELRQVGGRAERAVNPVAVADITDRLLEALETHSCRILLATVDGEAAGMAVLRVIRPDPLSTSRIAQVTHFVVARGKRRLGVGRALLAAAAEFAEDQQVEHVGVGVYPSLRDASRFYARLGFAPVLVQRAVPVPILRRRLGLEGATLRTDDLVRRRTRIRRPLPAQRRAGRAPATNVDR